MRNKIFRSRFFKSAVLIFGCLIVGVNYIAYQHAYRFTYYVSEDYIVPRLETISFTEKLQLLFTGLEVPRPANEHDPMSVKLSYEVHRIVLANEEYIEGWFIPHTNPKGLIVLFHGYAASKDSLLAPAVAFHDLGYSTFLIDFRGSGGSSGNDTTLGIREGVDVAETIRYVQATLSQDKPIILYGFSLGSAAILRAIATENIQPNAIILEHPFDTLLNTTRNRFIALGVPPFLTAEMLVMWGSLQQGFNGFELNPVDWVLSVKCPVLILHGEKDVRITKGQAYAIFERANVVSKHFITFPDSGHELLASTESEKWREYISSFLQDLKSK